MDSTVPKLANAKTEPNVQGQMANVLALQVSKDASANKEIVQTVFGAGTAKSPVSASKKTQICKQKILKNHVTHNLIDHFYAGVIPGLENAIARQVGTVKTARGLVLF